MYIFEFWFVGNMYDIIGELVDDEPVSSHDSSTNGLINFFKANRSTASKL